MALVRVSNVDWINTDNIATVFEESSTLVHIRFIGDLPIELHDDDARVFLAWLSDNDDVSALPDDDFA